MSKIVLYGIDLSPPVRACLLTLKALELDFEYKEVDLLKGEHMTEEFLKKNPQHTVPLLDDEGTLVWDSHAICCYLVDKYAKSDELYPKDLVKRAAVNQRLFFEASVLFMSLRSVSVAFFFNNVTVVPKEKTGNIIEGYDLVETFLGDKPYIAGDELTIADFCCAATVSTLPGIVPIDEAKYPKITAWLQRIAELPYYEEVNGVGAKKHIGIMKSSLTDVQV
ncbi:glutathione S-transferase 1-like [Scaptodrosophila lebanonensis]|uniref:Glutathione S-transferase 1-like n=1 Tax=Drosophila lebanonensis TaxID=7225 RepID=A0A6J2U045_DROLE|nr:glutathione S-transferase 1-like [Scaptodrosophila lebanonensis]